MRFERIGEQLAAFRGEVGNRWSKLTKTDLAGIDPDVDSLTGALSRRYSLSAAKAKQEAQQFLDGLGTTVMDAAHVVGDAARDLWRNGKHSVADVVQSGGQKVGDLLGAGREQLQSLQQRAGRSVNERPLTSIAVAVGVGALLGFLLRRR